MSVYYQDEWVTLYHGDCLTETAWLEADVLVTDPPYGRAWRQGEVRDPRGWGNKNRNAASVDGIANDSDTGTRDAALALWGTRLAIAFGDLMLAPPAGTKRVGIYHKADRTTGFRGAVGGVRKDTEAIYLIGPWVGGLGGRSSLFSSAAQISSAHGIVALSGGHPHTKPQDVMRELLALAEGTIADPFAGSGSTLIAAKQFGRRAIGVELEERYCEIAARRLAQDVLDFEGAS